MIIDINKVKVLYRNIPCGTLQTDPTNGVCVFEYDPSWLANGFSLSPTELPLQSGLIYADTVKMGGVFATFEDSLPDGYGLLLLDRLLKKQGSSLSELNPLQRLSVIGKSGMGALSYLPVMPGISGQKEVETTETLDILQEEALAMLSEKKPGDAEFLYYNSANSGGARPKAAFVTPQGEHWLVKFRHTYDNPDVGMQELLYMKTARECGVDIPKIGLLRNKYFAIERFDISPLGERYHVLTAAALLKTNFRNQDVDYTNLLALTGYLTQDPQQVEEMFRRMVVNIVAINKDDHAKNFSFIYKENKWGLAPAYDITYSPKGSNGQHATSVFFEGNPNLEQILKAGEGIRIPRSRCMEIIGQVESVCKHNLDRVNILT